MKQLGLVKHATTILEQDKFSLLFSGKSTNCHDPTCINYDWENPKVQAKVKKSPALLIFKCLIQAPKTLIDKGTIINKRKISFVR